MNLRHLFLFLFGFSAIQNLVAQEEPLVYSFDALVLNHVELYTMSPNSYSSKAVINSSDNSHYILITKDRNSDDLSLTLIDRNRGWYARCTVPNDTFNSENVKIELKATTLTKMYKSRSFKFALTDRGIYDTIIKENTYKSLKLKRIHKRKLIDYTYVIDTTYLLEQPLLSAELFSVNQGLENEFPKGRTIASIVRNKKGEPVQRTDLLSHVPIKLEIVFN